MTVNKQHQVFRAQVEYVQPNFTELKEIFGNDVDPDYDQRQQKNSFEAIEECRHVSRESRELNFVFHKTRSRHQDAILREMASERLRPALYEEFIACFRKYPEQFAEGVIVLGSQKQVEHWKGVATIYWDMFGWSLTLPVMGCNGTWDKSTFLAVRD